MNNDRSAPKGAPETPTKKSNRTVPQGPNLTASARRPFCSADVYRRRRLQIQHDVLHGRTYPTCPREPSTFLLESDALRRHGNQLHASGWSLDEITAVLDIPLAVSP